VFIITKNHFTSTVIHSIYPSQLATAKWLYMRVRGTFSKKGGAYNLYSHIQALPFPDLIPQQSSKKYRHQIYKKWSQMKACCFLKKK
jgi:hypothetical protein